MHASSIETRSTLPTIVLRRKKKRVNATRRFTRHSLGMAYYHRLTAEGIEDRYARKYAMHRYGTDPWDYLR